MLRQEVRDALFVDQELTLQLDLVRVFNAIQELRILEVEKVLVRHATEVNMHRDMGNKLVIHVELELILRQEQQIAASALLVRVLRQVLSLVHLAIQELTQILSDLRLAIRVPQEVTLRDTPQ